MIKDPKYVKAFNAGYKQGMIAGASGSKAEQVMRTDMLHIFGELCFALKRKGWKTESIEKLIFQIQEHWHKRAAEESKMWDEGIPIEPIQEKVYRETGVMLIQAVNDLAGEEKEVKDDD